MRIAVTYKNGNIFQHLGHTEQFKLYDIEDGKFVKTELIDTNGSGHGALVGVLSAVKADVLICGGIGGGARTLRKSSKNVITSQNCNLKYAITQLKEAAI